MTNTADNIIRMPAKPGTSPDQRILDRCRSRLDKISAEEGPDDPAELIGLADDLLRLQDRLADQRAHIGDEIRGQINRLKAAQAYQNTPGKGRG
ncbi:hypothetical protein [Aestuariispira insulae]|uniref:Uncharacterized protein n=1 Tax=Aestuariispira insulae TaxID=1461337 RepID=A0A3D9H5M6_9PROT|nr:hypothetical protein [Aestuariispira insulae]RED44805.1 hypothetical protein DFP90_11310 [Aestuariispira insulae]